MLLNVLRGLMRKAPQRAHRDEPEGAQAWLERGLKCQSLGQWQEAELALRRALTLDPGSVDATHVLGVLLQRIGRTAEAIALLERAAGLAPEQAAVHLHLGGAYHSAGSFEQALASFGRALRADPGLPATHSNLGNIYKQLGRLHDAEQSYRRALAIDPDTAEAWHNLGNVQRDMGIEEEALRSFERSLALNPQMLEARYSRALTLLALGRLAEGWAEHEVRFELPRLSRDLRPFPHPRWQGEPLHGRTIVVWGEQGIGDEILFAGMYRELTEQAGHSVFECSAKLVPLFARSFPNATVVARTKPPHAAAAGQADYQSAAGSLARSLRSSLASFPSQSRYLEADANRVQHWREQLAALGPGLKVGFSWRSGDLRGERALACTELVQWGELFAVGGVHWICLQYDECAAELDAARARFGVTLHRFEGVDYFDDLDEVSALTSALDLVISAPTTVSLHAAALGREVWQLAYGSDWQTHGTSAVPWYPSLHRHPRRWDQGWEGVLVELARRLRGRVNHHQADTGGHDSMPRLSAAISCFNAGDLAGAEARLQELIARDASSADGWLLLAMVLERAGRLREAYEHAEAATQAQTGFYEAHMQAGACARALDEPALAIAHFHAAQSLRSDAPEPTLGLAAALESAGKTEEAIGEYRKATGLAPGNADVWLNLSSLLHRHGDLTAACEAAQRAVELKPDSAKAQFNLGSVYKDQDALVDAAEHLTRSTQLDSNYPPAWLALGEALQHSGQFGRAETCYRKALALDPASATARLDLGALCYSIGRMSESIEFFTRVIAEHTRDATAAACPEGTTPSRLRADDARNLPKPVARAGFNLALAELAQGNFTAGWEGYEWRFHPHVRVARRHELGHRQWRGEPLAGRRIAVWGEQGIGDEIFFAGLYPELIAAAGHCVLECKAKLVPLFARSFPAATVVARTEPAHQATRIGVDYQSAAGSLARYLRPSLGSFPSRPAYLIADAARVQHWASRLDALGSGLKVGFCWRSSNLKGERALACTQLTQWRELLPVAGVHWISLQYDDCAAELDAARARFGAPLHRFDDVDYYDDLDEVSALMSALDLVISAPTTVSVHAAALGIDVWQMSFGTDWQTHGTKGVPWYPTLNRYERGREQTWESVLAGLAGQLRTRVAASS
jgi:tetratricopeptide (TPR) repeat protein